MILLLSVLVFFHVDINGQRLELSKCDPELSATLELIFEHPKIKKHLGQFLIGDTLLLNSELAPQCGQPTNLEMGDYRILIRGINDVFFEDIDYHSASNRILSFRTNYAWTYVELLLISQKKSFHISTYVTHQQKEKDGLKSGYEIRDLTTSLGRIKKK